jgi:hypothetical protein
MEIFSHPLSVLICIGINLISNVMRIFRATERYIDRRRKDTGRNKEK